MSAKVISFQQREPRRQRAANGTPAEIIIFPGVRKELLKNLKGSTRRKRKLPLKPVLANVVSE